MSDVVVITFENPAKADMVFNDLKKLDKKHQLELRDEFIC